ncbi:hypothetical protein D9M68_853560 [compost metagenome]
MASVSRCRLPHYRKNAADVSRCRLNVTSCSNNSRRRLPSSSSTLRPWNRFAGRSSRDSSPPVLSSRKTSTSLQTPRATFGRRRPCLNSA